jgi:hypothetical protein
MGSKSASQAKWVANVHEHDHEHVEDIGKKVRCSRDYRSPHNAGMSPHGKNDN